MITYEFLQQYWWFIMSLLGGLLVFLLFVQGGQSMLGSLARQEDEKRLLVNALGRKWEYTFTTLVTFGGAFFALFPVLFYQLRWRLLGLDDSALSASCYRLFPMNFSRSREIFSVPAYTVLSLFLNGVLGTFLLGVLVATFFTGSEFTVGKGNIAGLGSSGFVISQWQNPLHGLESLANLRNLCLGFAVLFLARTLASLYS